MKIASSSNKINDIYVDVEMSVVSMEADSDYHIIQYSTEEYSIPEPDFKTVIRKGYSPYISDETGTWWEYDDKLKKYIDTGVPAASNLFPLTEDEINILWNNITKEGE